MTAESNNKALMTRWYDEMWAERNFDLITELAGPNYTRHDMMGTRTVTAEEYRDSLKAFATEWRFTDFHYFLMSEKNFITAIGSWKVHNADGNDGVEQWDWVQTFRVENNKLVETWLPGMGGKDVAWSKDEIPAAI